ncbi:MAG TPA: SMP-30/gluconolactonase/LRE family protein [Pyrinomonadaceae bacterium]|nr:SMP-30/gluconolactonase/LRE family protein [Pyrinomonadaceae bacterium]
MSTRSLLSRLQACLRFTLALSVLVVAGGAVPAAGQAPWPSTVEPGAKLSVVYEDARFFEGPSWDPATARLYFTAFEKGNEQVLRLDAPGKVTVWMDRTQGVNGTYLSRTGRLLAAQAFGHNLLSMRVGPAGPEDIKSLTSGFEGVPYIQPNDVAESPTTGGVYYTDPNFKGKTRSAVYYLSPDGAVRRVVENLKLPNGVEVSNDGRTLYVGDSFEKRVYSYPILPDGSVDQGQVKIFFDPQTENQNDPDGMTSDAGGNLYFAMRGGVWVVTPEGKSLGLIPVPEFTSNVTFGGDDGRTLYVTCDKRVYALRMSVKGAQFK